MRSDIRYQAPPEGRTQLKCWRRGAQFCPTSGTVKRRSPVPFSRWRGSAVFSDWFVIGLTEEDWRGLCQFERSYCKTGSASNGREPMAFASRERRSKPGKEQQDAERDRLEAALEAGLEGTFSASDAVAVTQPAPERYTGPNN